ncbi:ATP-binding protein [Couchioplanes caeruleus subsp. azureus]|uniref:ATP-binding protein n=1 Tax=Couchioplanes caeruleus TaxID=56438 RepID=UPI0016710BD7
MESSVAVLAVHGTYVLRLQRDAHLAVRKCLSGHPAGLIADLQELDDPTGASAGLWLTICRRAERMDPPVQVVVCAPADSEVAARLQRWGARRFLPVFATMEQARAAACERRPLTDRIVVRLPAGPGTAVPARRAVTEACAAWHLGDLADRAELVVSELVANAAQHAGTPITLVVSRRGTGVHLMVHDGDPILPRLLAVLPTPAGVLPSRGLGLAVVHAAATVWGAIPTAQGKAVWATIRPEVAKR